MLSRGPSVFANMRDRVVNGMIRIGTAASLSLWNGRSGIVQLGPSLIISIKDVLPCPSISILMTSSQTAPKMRASVI